MYIINPVLRNILYISLTFLYIINPVLGNVLYISLTF